MFCQNCGKEIPENLKSCPNCGVKTNKKKKSRKNLLIIFAVLLVVIIAVSTGGNSSDEPTKSTTKVTTVESQVKSTQTTTTEKSNVFLIGEVMETKTVKITFKSAEKWNKYNSFNAPKRGNDIIRVGFEIENKSSADLFYNPYDFDCYVDGVACEKYIWAEDLMQSGTLSSGRKASGYVYFEVPEDSKEAEIEYETNFWTSNKVIFKAEF